MLATELLFVYVYCLVDDAIKAAHCHPASSRSRSGLHDAELLDDRAGPSPARPPQRERVPGRDPPRLAAPVPAPAGPAGGQPPHPLAMGRLRAAARRLGRRRARRSGPADRYLRDPGQAPLPGPRRGPAGPVRATTWPPGSAATARTPNGSTASAWPSAPTWAGASSAPGPSCPPPSTNGRSAPTWSPATPPPSMRCCWTRGSPAAGSPPRWPTAGLTCSSRPPGCSARPCPRRCNG